MNTNNTLQKNNKEMVLSVMTKVQ